MKKKKMRRIILSVLLAGILTVVQPAGYIFAAEIAEGTDEMTVTPEQEESSDELISENPADVPVPENIEDASVPDEIVVTEEDYADESALDEAVVTKEDSEADNNIELFDAQDSVDCSGGGEGTADEDWLFTSMGERFKVKQGKSVALNTATSLDTKKNKLTYKIENDKSGGMITVTSTGVVKVNKNAVVGSTAMVAAYCAGYVARNTVIVAPADDETPRFTLDPVSATISTDESASNHTVVIRMYGGSDDAEKTYKLEITGKGGARFSKGKSEKRAWAYGWSDTSLCTIVAEKPGKVTLTVTATDGSNYSQKVNINVVSPLKGVDITYAGVPIRGEHIQMAKGASLNLKAAAIGASDSAVSGKVKYTWSGQYVNKSGKVTIPKEGADFTATVTAEDENGNTASRSLRIWGGKNSKLVYMGYAMKSSKGTKYYNSVNSLSPLEGGEYVVGGCYGYSDQNMPSMSSLGLSGPYGFAQKSSKDFKAWDYSNNNGQYVISVKGPSVTNVIYGNYGIQGFTPGKAGAYKFIFTALDGSNKTFTVNFKVK